MDLCQDSLEGELIGVISKCFALWQLLIQGHFPSVEAILRLIYLVAYSTCYFIVLMALINVCKPIGVISILLSSITFHIG